MKGRLFLLGGIFLVLFVVGLQASPLRTTEENEDGKDIPGWGHVDVELLQREFQLPSEINQFQGDDMSDFDAAVRERLVRIRMGLSAAMEVSNQHAGRPMPGVTPPANRPIGELEEPADNDSSDGDDDAESSLERRACLGRLDEAVEALDADKVIRVASACLAVFMDDSSNILHTMILRTLQVMPAADEGVVDDQMIMEASRCDIMQPVTWSSNLYPRHATLRALIYIQKLFRASMNNIIESDAFDDIITRGDPMTVLLLSQSISGLAMDFIIGAMDAAEDYTQTANHLTKSQQRTIQAALATGFDLNFPISYTKGMEVPFWWIAIRGRNPDALALFEKMEGRARLKMVGTSTHPGEGGAEIRPMLFIRIWTSASNIALLKYLPILIDVAILEGKEEGKPPVLDADILHYFRSGLPPQILFASPYEALYKMHTKIERYLKDAIKEHPSLEQAYNEKYVRSN